LPTNTEEYHSNTKFNSKYPKGHLGSCDRTENDCEGLTYIANTND